MGMKMIYRLAKETLSNLLTMNSNVYRFSLQRGLSGPLEVPKSPWHNAVLKSQSEIDDAVEHVKNLRLPLMKNLPKNWDSIAALDCIMRNTNTDARVFDAGAERYSVVLPWLFLYGYKQLVGGNLVFNKSFKKGPILYCYCDITKTGFIEESFDAVSCLSVIEHGVDLASYFGEMARILKPNGILVTSADYYEDSIDTKGQQAYGVPIKIFTKECINDALGIAKEFGLVLTSPLDLTSKEKPVYWEKYNLNYTFVVFTLRKEVK
jgi:SAM-dependent methyltransferase